MNDLLSAVITILLISLISAECQDKTFYSNYNNYIQKASLEISCEQDVSFAILSIQTLKLKDVTLQGVSDGMLSGGGYTARILSVEDDRVEVQVTLDKMFQIDLVSVDHSFCKNESLYFVSEMCNTVMEYTSTVTVICDEITFDIVYEDNAMEEPVISTHYKILEDKYKIFYQNSPVGAISFGSEPSMNVTIAEDCEFSLFEKCTGSDFCTRGCSETDFYMNPTFEAGDLVTASLNISCSEEKYDVLYTTKVANQKQDWKGNGGLQGRYIVRDSSSFNSITFKDNLAFAAYHVSDSDPEKTYTLEIPGTTCINKTYNLVSEVCMNEGRVEGTLEILCHGIQFEMIFSSTVINERCTYYNIEAEYYYFPQTGSSSKWVFSLQDEITVAMYLKNADYSCNFTIPSGSSGSVSESEGTEELTCEQKCLAEGNDSNLCSIYCTASNNPLYFVIATSVLVIVIVLIVAFCCCCCKKRNKASFNYELTQT